MNNTAWIHEDNKASKILVEILELDKNKIKRKNIYYLIYKYQDKLAKIRKLEKYNEFYLKCTKNHTLKILNKKREFYGDEIVSFTSNVISTLYTNEIRKLNNTNNMNNNISKLDDIYDQFNSHKKIETQPCLHKQCEICNGTGKKEDGSLCIHFISCPCPKCSPKY